MGDTPRGVSNGPQHFRPSLSLLSSQSLRELLGTTPLPEREGYRVWEKGSAI